MVDLRLTLRNDAIVASVLRRVLVASGAQAGMTVDRLNDIEILADLIAREALAHAVDATLTIRVAVAGDGHLRIVIGPLQRGGFAALSERVTLPEVGSVLDATGATMVAEPGDGAGEFVTLSLADEHATELPRTR